MEEIVGRFRLGKCLFPDVGNGSTNAEDQDYVSQVGSSFKTILNRESSGNVGRNICNIRNLRYIRFEVPFLSPKSLGSPEVDW